jgi:hypothetical protein
MSDNRVGVTWEVGEGRYGFALDRYTAWSAMPDATAEKPVNDYPQE